jgi:hypothetical protein
MFLSPAGRSWSLWIAVSAVLWILAGPARGQQEDGDDQGWAQFSRESTVRGTVLSGTPKGKNDGSLTLKTDSGQQWQVLYGANTRIMRDRNVVRPSEIQIGDMVFAAGNLDDKKKTVGAAILIDVPAEVVQKAREGLGKTWSAGKITSIAGTRIQVHRLDGVEQSIAVDENTSFRQRRDAVTLADLRPGQGFRAEGHMMNGIFTATTLTVFDLKGHEPWLDAGSEAR